MPELEFLGTGDAGQVPRWGCDCDACQRARLDPARKRRPCSAALHTEEGTTLIDAGCTDLAERFAFDDIRRVLLTHFHMDHVQGLFHLRWGQCRSKIPVYRPDDPKGADDLYRHPGVFKFQPPCSAFERQQFPGFDLTPLPLLHSRPTQGLLIETPCTRLAWLTDTLGLPRVTQDFLQQQPRLDWLVLDCSEPPRQTPPRNHNDLTRALHIHHLLAPGRTLLTHIGHEFDDWLESGRGDLPATVSIARDGLRISL